MNPVTGIVVYIVIWWVVLFMVLPWGVSRTENPEAGHDHGAPARPMLVRKVLATSVISAVLFAGILALVSSGVVSLEDLAERFAVY